MAKDKDNSVQTAEPVDNIADGAAETQIIPDETAAEVPVVKTRKELKKERKELKKHKKEVKKEAKQHSATTTKAERVGLALMRIFVIVIMIACVVLLFKTYRNMSADAPADGGNAVVDETPNETPNGGGSDNNSDTDTPAVSDGEDESGEDSGNSSGGADAPAGAMQSKEEIVEYYKKAHAKALSSAKTATKFYDNTVNYKDVLEIGGNSILEKVAKSLMGQFMKEDTEEHAFSSGDIAANFPPAGKNTNGLTADMIADAKCEDKGDKYVITLVTNSTEEAFDTGDKAGNLVTIIEDKTVMDAAGSAVKLTGLEIQYFNSKLIATVDKATGNLESIETYVPSYMCFTEAKVTVVSVKNCRIGLEYQQKWKLEY